MPHCRRRVLATAAVCLCSWCPGQSQQLDPLVLRGIQERRAGDYAASIQTLTQAVELAHKSGNLEGEEGARTFLALTFGVKGDLTKAAALQEDNLKFVRQHRKAFVQSPMNREADLLDWLGGVYASLGRHATAIAYLKQNLAAQAGDEKISLGKPKALYKLGVAFMLAGQTAQAQLTLQQSYQAFEESKQVRLEGKATQEYEVELIRRLEQLAVAQGKTDEALALAQRSRAGSLSMLLSSRQGTASAEGGADAVSVDKAAGQLAKEEAATVVEYSIGYVFDPLLPLEFSDYKTHARRLFIWVVKPTGQISFRQVDFGSSGIALADLIQQARASIGVRGRGVAALPEPGGTENGTENGTGNGKGRLQELHRVLIQPIEDLLPSDPKARVLIIPQDVLYLVPFAALQDASGQYLIEKHTLSSAISMSVMSLSQARLKELGNAGKGILVIGNPVMPTLPAGPDEPGGKLPALPGAEKEAKEIARIFGAAPLTGERATKLEVLKRMPQARMLHFATHGLLVAGDDALLSALAFAPSGQDRGFLQAREIHTLKLNAEMAVLSACDTGKGKITGDGVVGLARSFVEAGVPSVVVSLWSVEDDPTAKLMTTFYTQLRNGNDKAQALRTAMLSTMKIYHQPRAWAAFTLFGAVDASKTLATVRGDSPATGAMNQARYTASFPLPDGIKNYRESADFRFPTETDFTFSTSLTMAAVLAFYRQAFANTDLHENAELTQVDARSLSVVFQGRWKDRVLHISCVDFGNDRTVSLSYESR